jgi:hypothetical protein
MGWFFANRKPFSERFFRRLDDMEKTLTTLSERVKAAERLADPELKIIPIEITATRVENGREESSWIEVVAEPNVSGARSSDSDLDEFGFPAVAPMQGGAFVVKHVLDDVQDADGKPPVKFSLVAPGRSFWGVIVSSTLISSNRPAWSYTIDEVSRDDASDDGWAAVVNGLTGITAYNSLEAGNTSELAYGIGVAYSDEQFYLSCPDYEDRLAFGPVPDDAVVRVWSEMVGTDSVWTFSAPNPVSGCVECPEEELNLEEEEEE